MYRIQDGKLQVLLAHPGGPLFKKKDNDTWTIPKGELDPGEDCSKQRKENLKKKPASSPVVHIRH